MLACLALLVATHWPPRFGDYPVRHVYRGRTAPLPRRYRNVSPKTNIFGAIEGRADFAGHYIVAIGSHGTFSYAISVIDARTGNIVWLDHTFAVDHDDHNPVRYHLTSRLLVVHGFPEFNDAANSFHYFVVTHGRVIELHRRLRPAIL
jgi:hypothetical protein